MSFSSHAEESAPLTTELSPSSGHDIHVKDRRRRSSRSNNFFFSSFTQKKQPPQTNDCNNHDYDDSGSDNNGVDGYDYKHANPLRKGKYQGYCTLGTDIADGGAGGRVSLLDDWDFSPQKRTASYDDSDDDEDGEFVSYWGQSSDNDDDQSSSSESQTKKQSPIHHTANNDQNLDDRVETTIRPISLRYRKYQGGMRESFTENKDVTNDSVGNERNNRRGEGILLSLPIVRPFLRRSHQGFSDQANQFDSNDDVGEDDHDNDDCNNASSKEDRAAVMKSISDGIAGTQTKDHTLQNGATALHNSTDEIGQPSSPPNLLGRLFLTRFIQIPHHNQETLLLRQLHDLLRKEDWSLATELLESKPMLARKWHCVKRLYGGKFDAEALPIHSACALCPPASFIQTLATMYPEGLLMKEKAFGRTPLHIACRSLADSSVIKVLCEMEPMSVVERDSLKRAPLHYLIKNYNTFGQDEDADENVEDDSPNDSTANDDCSVKTADGIIALKLLVETNTDCVKVADHRGWIPLHVACSCSARKGMIPVMKMLIEWWPESVNVKTEKNSDVFACVEMVGKHHATKDRVVSLLKEARHELETSSEGNELDCSSVSNVVDTPSPLSLDPMPDEEDQDVDTKTATKEDVDRSSVSNMIDTQLPHGLDPMPDEQGVSDTNTATYITENTEKEGESDSLINLSET